MARKKSSIDVKRHSLAHVMAAAVERLYPNANIKFGVGPVVENGFFYDFQNAPLSEDKLPSIEKEMRSIIAENQAFTREEMSPNEAIAFFQKRGQNFKVELLEDLLKYGTTSKAAQEESPDFARDKQQDLPETDKVTDETPVSLYKTGAFADLCRGPHIGSTQELNPDAFKLVRIAGAYWRGNENNPQMQRVYAVAFDTKEELNAYLTMMEEAKKRDHRVLGKKLDLFVFSDLIGAGLPLWTPKGTVVRRLLDDFVWQLRSERGYERVEIPHITKKDLYETSGHWEKFNDDLFKMETREGHLFALKPMNCPHHTQIYARERWSYRDLPQRYADTTMVYRDEQSGELQGLTRVRAITQDDAHVFCREEDVKKEAFNIWDIVETFYGAFEFDLRLRLATHNPDNMDAFLGSIDTWEEAVATFKTWIKERGVSDYEEARGEAAFYGPKIDFMAKDSLGREWQVATIQIDRSMPERFDLTCINEKGNAERIVMLHAAIMGSIERFLAILIEHLAGNFPTWLSPVQARVIPISEKQGDYARTILKTLKIANIRAEIDEASETVGNRIRKSEQDKIPYTLVVGEKEEKEQGVAVRIRGVGDIGMISLEALTKPILVDIMGKALEPKAP